MHRLSLIGVVLALAFAAANARAQCGATVSGCRQCHEIEKQHPVLADRRPWHADHAFGDFCADCHGGDRAGKDVAAAHAGLAAPLGDVAARCGSATCHGGDAAALAGRYRRAPPAISAPPPPPRKPARNAFAIAVAALVALVGGAYVAWNERHRRLQESA